MILGNDKEMMSLIKENKNFGKCRVSITKEILKKYLIK